MITKWDVYPREYCHCANCDGDGDNDSDNDSNNDSDSVYTQKHNGVGWRSVYENHATDNAAQQQSTDQA